MNIVETFQKKFKIKTVEISMDECLKHGKEFLEKKLYDSAMVEFSKAATIDKPLAIAKMTEMYQELQGRVNSEEFIAVVTNLILLEPGNVKLTNLLANAYRHGGHYNQALQLYKRCLEIDPNANFPAYNLAATTAHVELYDAAAIAAIADFEKTTNFVLPEEPEGLARLQEMDKKMKLEEAKEFSMDELTAPSKKGASPPPAKKKSPEEEAPDEMDADKLFQYVCLDSSLTEEDTQQLMYALGLYCLKKGDPNIASAAFMRMSLIESASQEKWSFFALSYALQGLLKKAIEKMSELRDQFPNNRYYNVNLGHLYQRADQMTFARKYFFITYRLLKASRGLYEVSECIEMADTHFELKRYKNAFLVYKGIIEELNSLEKLLRTGKLALQFKDFETALRAFQLAATHDAQHKDVKLGLKLVNQHYLDTATDFMKKEKWSKAVQFLEMSIDLYPSEYAITKAMDVYRMVPDLKKVKELENRLNGMAQEKLDKELKEKLDEADRCASKGLFKSAMQNYQAALQLKPDREVYLKMVALCEKSNQKELINKVSAWYQKVVDDAKKAALEDR